MANKRPTRLLFVEPNKPGLEIPNTEDLSIFVELKTITRGRSLITGNADTGSGELNNNSGSDISSKTIGFLDGTAIGAGRRSLTTNYTEVNTNFSVDGENDLETLGIESINISFDTAYTPIVNIKFIDVRGQAVLQQGTNSKYKMFFELPYPIFELTVKGFYGKAVTYCLHLTKWNASFNSNSGNFEINADFIGYTYALLTDCMLGLMRACVFTRIGEEKFNSYLSQYPNLITIDDFLDYVNKLGDEFERIKTDNENIKQLNSLTELKKNIAKISGKISRLKSSISNRGKDDLLSNSLSNRVLIGIGENNVKINKDISDYKKENITFVNGDKTSNGINEDIEISDLKINLEDINNIIETSLTRNNFNDEETLYEAILEENKQGYGGDLEYVRELANKVSRAYNDTIKFNSSIVRLFDFGKAYNEINRIENAIKVREKKLKDNIANELKNASNKLSFKPTIRNIVSMLAIHAQVFLETIKEVSRLAEKSLEREDILIKQLTYNNINIKEGSTIFPWPEYREFKYDKDEGDTSDSDSTTQGGYYEKWIGSKLNEYQIESVEEVKFVEELLHHLMKLGKRDEKRVRDGFGLSPEFYPVSPFEAPIPLNGNDSLIIDNPYKNALLSDRSKATPGEVYRCLLMRGFLGLGLSNRINGGNHVNIMGKLEADNLFNVIVNEFEKDKRDDLIKAISKLDGGNTSASTKTIINKWIDGTFNDVNHPPKSNGKLLKEINGEYQYTYLVNDGFNKTSYIPISGGFDGIDFFNGSGSTSTFKSITELKNLSESLLFTSDNYKSNIDDGSILLKIISSSNYTNNSINPNFDDDSVLNKYFETVGQNSLINQKYLKRTTYEDTPIAKNDALNRYNGRYKTLEINNIVYNGPDDDGDLKVEKIHYIDNNISGEYGSDAGTVISSYYFQDEDPESGTYLAKSLENIENKTDLNRIKKYEINLNDENAIFSVHLSSDDDDRDDLLPPEYGKTRELIGNAELNNSDIYLPYLEFSVSNNIGVSDDHFSLFGSKWYYSQSNYGRAFLFLHSIPWQGIIGDINELTDSSQLTDENTFEVSLFDTKDSGGGSFQSEDDTYTIKGLYGNSGSFIKAPKLWCAFIGGLLYRYDNYDSLNSDSDIIKFKGGINNSEGLLPWQDTNSYTPKYDEYLYEIVTYTLTQSGQKSCGIHFFFDAGDSIRNDGAGGALSPDEYQYAKVDQVILNMPKQAREEFKKVFEDFVNKDFKAVQSKYELFNSVNDLEDKWRLINNKVQVTKEPGPIRYVNSGSIAQVNATQVQTYTYRKTLKVGDITTTFIGKDNVLKNYFNISPLPNLEDPVNLNSKKIYYNDLYQFDLTFNESKDNKNLLIGLLGETNYIMNGSPRVFRVDKDKDIKVNKNDLEGFIFNFFTRFNELAKQYEDPNKDENDEIQKKIFNTIDDETIKLSIYRTLSSINNKWLGGDINNKCANISNIVNTFKYLDSSFLDIGDKFLINPQVVYNGILNNYNQSFFDVVNKLLLENNFNFIPLPSFINFNDEESLKNDVFKPYSFKETVSSNNVGPSFVCVYTGQKSSNLNLGEDSEYEDDGVYINSDGNGTIVGPVPELFSENGNQKAVNIPYFLVSYGKGNQSIFKDVKLDQREFTETQESLEIIEDLSEHGNKKKATFKGQNLFNVYQQRAYSAEVEMMGNAMIQPMMYFQLNNIPMFRGAYLIFNTSHSITAHNMKTTFKGSRIKKTKTPLIDENQLLMNLIGPLEEVGEAESITDADLTEEGETKTTDGGGSSRNQGDAVIKDGSSSSNGSKAKTTPESETYSVFIDTPMDINLLPISNEPKNSPSNPNIKPITPKEELKYGIREVVETIQTAFSEFIEEAKKTTDINEYIFWNDISYRNGGLTKDHKSHQIGVDIDFRQILSRKESINNTAFDNRFFQLSSNSIDGTLKSYKDGKLKLINPVNDNRDSIGDYSRKGTELLIQKLRKIRKPIKLKDGTEVKFATINQIWFNDPVLIEKGLCSPEKGHDNHLHVRFNIPERVQQSIAENTSGEPQNTENTRRFYS